MQGLASEVAELTGARVRGATLAKRGALEEAVEGLERPLVFPHFMADGWFVSSNLPKRLAASGLAAWEMTTPLGMTRALPKHAMQTLHAALVEDDLPANETTLVVAAHGAPSDPRPARATEAFAMGLRDRGNFAEVRVGYVDEDPSIEEAAKVSGPAIVLPFFAARAGHVLMDLPEALAAAAFQGAVLPPIGTWSEIPALIAETLIEAAEAQVV